MTETFYCPRRDDMSRWGSKVPFFFDPEMQVGTTPLVDDWREPDPAFYGVHAGLPTCSYCGSIRPVDFVEALKAGREIHGTDKRYKAYVILPNPNAGNPRVDSAIDFEPRPEEAARWTAVTDDNRHLLERDGWGRGGIGTERYRWMHIGPDGPTSQAKFYFQHLAHPCPERAAFYDWYLEHPSVFYSGAPLGLHLEHIARHPDQMTDDERAALVALRARSPELEIAAP